LTEQNTSNQAVPKSLSSEALSILIVIILALGVRIFVLELFYVPTGSMKGTILEGDYIFSTKYSYGYSIYSFPFNPDIFEDRILANAPERGDVIIMRPPHDMEERYIKRLLGLPGDKIQIIDDLIYINETPITRVEVGDYVDEEGINFRKFKETLPNGASYFSYKMKYPSTKITVDHSNFGPHIVEPGRYFFIGDNRDSSGDSRYQLGTVPFRNFIAKGRFVLFSTKHVLWDPSQGFFGQIKRVGTWFMSIRFSRFFNSLYEPNTSK
jgi:signal peptidase I